VSMHRVLETFPAQHCCILQYPDGERKIEDAQLLAFADPLESYPLVGHQARICGFSLRLAG